MRAPSRSSSQTSTVLLSLLAWSHIGWTSNVEEDVLVLTDMTINATLQSQNHVLLKLVPEYAAAATTLQREGVAAALAKVDATANPKTAEWLGVKGYPTLMWFSEGHMKEVYSAARSRDAIVNWVKKRVSGVEPVTTLEQLESLKGRSEVFLHGYLCSEKSQELEVLLEVAKAIEEWPVYYTSNAEVATALGLTACSSYIVGTRFDLNKGAFVSVSSEGHEAFEEDRSLKESLLRFLKTEQLPPYLPYSSTTNQRVFAMDRQVFLVGPLLDLQPDKPALQAVEVTHGAFKGQFAFATAALGTDPADMLLDFFGLRKSKEIQVIAFVPEKEKYKLLEPLTADSLSKFCQGVVDKTYRRYYKSAQLPLKPKDGFVRVVVGETYDDTILDSQRDVLILAYTMWSDKSKYVSVVWKKLAQQMRQVDSLVVAKIEADANEHPHLADEAYPCILFYAAGSSQPLKYEGEHHLKDMLRFIKEHATVPIDFSTELPRTPPSRKDEL